MAVLLPTAYLPPASYMAVVLRSDHILIEACETYPKQTIRNHCEICGPNGRHKLTIPVVKPHGNHTMTRDIAISDHEPWQKIHWRSIETAYNNSPFFLYYADHFRPFFLRPFFNLLEYNLELLQTIMMCLNLSIPIESTQSFDTMQVTNDFRFSFFEKRTRESTPVQPYYQVFGERLGFIPDLSILDVLFNLGPETHEYLNKFHLPR